MKRALFLLLVLVAACKLNPAPEAPTTPSENVPEARVRPTPRPEGRPTPTGTPTSTPTATPTQTARPTPDTGEPAFSAFTLNPTEGVPLRPNRSAVWIAPRGSRLVACLEATVEGACTGAFVTVCSAASGVEVSFRTLTGPGRCTLRFVYRDGLGAVHTLFPSAAVRGL